MEVYKTDYPEDYKYYCRGYLGQVLASNSKSALKKAVLDWPRSSYEIIENTPKVNQATMRARCTLKLVTPEGKNLDISLGAKMTLDSVIRVLHESVKCLDGDESVRTLHVAAESS